MKKLFFVSGLLVLSCYAIGQAKDGTLDLNKYAKVEQAAMINLPYAPAVVETALNNYLNKTSVKEQKTATNFLLSNNTLLVKDNISKTDMVFEIGAKDYAHPNETVIFLKLNSKFPNSDNEDSVENSFTMNNAINYLDNLSVAIKPYATNLQIKLQKNELEKALEDSSSLAIEGMKLEQNRIKIMQDLSTKNSDHKTDRLLKKQIRNKQQIDLNMIAKIKNNEEINYQILALNLLNEKE